MRTPPFKPLQKKVKRGFKGYPLATIMFYGPDDQTATKVAVAIIPGQGQAPTDLRRWTRAHEVRKDPTIGEEVRAFVEEKGATTVAMTGKVNGCPHEEGVDYEGDTCPRCPFWAGRDRWIGKVLH